MFCYPYNYDRGVVSEATINGTVIISNHLLSPLYFLSPFESATLKGSVVVSWSDVVCTFEHLVYYTLRLLSDGGLNFVALSDAVNIDRHNYTWETTLVSDGANYKLQITAQGDGGLEKIGFTTLPLTVHNVELSEELRFMQTLLILVTTLGVIVAMVSAYFIWRNNKLKRQLLTKEEKLRRYAARAKDVLQSLEE